MDKEMYSTKTQIKQIITDNKISKMILVNNNKNIKHKKYSRIRLIINKTRQDKDKNNMI